MFNKLKSIIKKELTIRQKETGEILRCHLDKMTVGRPVSFFRRIFIKSARMDQRRNRCTLCLLYDEKKNDTGGRHMEQYAYIRVSTKEQNIDRQLLALEQYHIPPRNIVGDKK